jgi:hypothetical protein
MIRKAGPQEEIGQPEIGYVSQTAKPEEIPEAIAKPAPEIGCDSQNAPPEAALTSPELLDQLETMTTPEAIAFFDKLTAPPA